MYQLHQLPSDITHTLLPDTKGCMTWTVTSNSPVQHWGMQTGYSSLSPGSSASPPPARYNTLYCWVLHITTTVPSFRWVTWGGTHKSTRKTHVVSPAPPGHLHSCWSGMRSSVWRQNYAALCFQSVGGRLRWKCDNWENWSRSSRCKTFSNTWRCLNLTLVPNSHTVLIEVYRTLG